MNPRMGLLALTLMLPLHTMAGGILKKQTTLRSLQNFLSPKEVRFADQQELTTSNQNNELKVAMLTSLVALCGTLLVALPQITNTHT